MQTPPVGGAARPLACRGRDNRSCRRRQTRTMQLWESALMNKLPGWAKAILAIVVFAILYGAAQLLLFLDKTSSGKAGLD